jgi:hypothetical protein
LLPTGFQHSRAPAKMERGCVSETSLGSKINASEHDNFSYAFPSKFQPEMTLRISIRASGYLWSLGFTPF